MASPYIAIDKGSPCVVPSLDRITLLVTKILDGLVYECFILGSIEGNMLAMFFNIRPEVHTDENKAKF